jgi:hypothetical protein
MATFTVKATGLVELGDVGPASGSKVIQFVGTGFSATVKGRVKGSGATAVLIPYKSRFVNTAVGTEAYVTTALTGNSLIEVNANGIDVVLDFGTWASNVAVYTNDSLA